MENETAPAKPSGRKPLLIVLGLLALLLVAAGLWYFLFRNSADKPNPSSQKTATTSTETATSTPKVVETTDDEELIKKALVAKTGIEENVIEVTVSQKSGNFAKGLVGAKGEMGGGYWIAVKENGSWTIVFDGQATPECALINPYNFPRAMVPECLDAAGNPVTR
jgi:hypothetical protein